MIFNLANQLFSSFSQICFRHTALIDACYTAVQVRTMKVHIINRPSPGPHNGSLRFKVHYPEDEKYTIKPLKMTKLAGRSPETGRIIHGKLGGGAKRRFRWIDIFRFGPKDGSFLEEKVIKILRDPNRACRIALVGHGENLRYILASEFMKDGDIIRTSSYIPPMPVQPKHGDAYPLGALPLGTQVHCIERVPGDGMKFVTGAGCSAKIVRRLDTKVIIKLPSKQEVVLQPECMCVVGRLSNPDHKNEHIGSAQRSRWLGNRPSSGLWQRKDGRFGRKLKAPKPLKFISPQKEPVPVVQLTIPGEGPRRRVIPSTLRVT